jgi:hypothetical protein
MIDDPEERCARLIPPKLLTAVNQWLLTGKPEAASNIEQLKAEYGFEASKQGLEWRHGDK